MSSVDSSRTSGDFAYAPAPFNHEKADIILRSSDKIDFRVFRLFLSLASSFFETLFNIPQPVELKKGQEIKDGLAVIPMAEDSKTLDVLLRFCYPCTLAEDPKIELLTDALRVLEAARKYSLNSIEKKACQAISNPKILEKEPLRCFAIARRGRLREETLLAAKYTLTQPLIPSWFLEIGLLSAADLLSLLTYHQRCGDAVYALRLDLSWIVSHYRSVEACSWLAGRYQRKSDRYAGTSSNSCGCPRSGRSGPQTLTSEFKQMLFGAASLLWWKQFMEETFTELRDKPCRETLEDHAEKTVQSVKALNCPACSPMVTEGMKDFVDLFARKIEDVVSEIELVLIF